MVGPRLISTTRTGAPNDASVPSIICTRLRSNSSSAELSEPGSRASSSLGSSQGLTTAGAAAPPRMIGTAADGVADGTEEGAEGTLEPGVPVGGAAGSPGLGGLANSGFPPLPGDFDSGKGSWRASRGPLSGGLAGCAPPRRIPLAINATSSGTESPAVNTTAMIHHAPMSTALPGAPSALNNAHRITAPTSPPPWPAPAKSKNSAYLGAVTLGVKKCSVASSAR